MTTQTSRLSIVIDTANAQSNIERLRTSLHRLGTDGTTASNILSRMGATGGLSNIINRVGQTNNAFRQFSQMGTAYMGLLVIYAYVIMILLEQN